MSKGCWLLQPQGFRGPAIRGRGLEFPGDFLGPWTPWSCSCVEQSLLCSIGLSPGSCVQAAVPAATTCLCRERSVPSFSSLALSGFILLLHISMYVC